MHEVLFAWLSVYDINNLEIIIIYFSSDKWCYLCHVSDDSTTHTEGRGECHLQEQLQRKWLHVYVIGHVKNELKKYVDSVVPETIDYGHNLN